MPDLRIDASELDGLVRDFLTAPAKVIPAIMPTAYRAANNMKRVMKSDASGHRHLPGLPSTVEYDVESSPRSVEITVGFRKQGQGNLANIAAFGSPNSAPVMDITRGLREEVPSFMKWAAKIAAEAI